MKSFIFVIALFLARNSYTQDIQVFFDTSNGQINAFLYQTDTATYFISKEGYITAIVLGEFSNQKKYKNLVTVNGVTIYADSFFSIDYPVSTNYATCNDFPSEINRIPIKYYDNYYDDSSVQRKIKSVGNDRLYYITEYYKDNALKGRIHKINALQITYSEDYTFPEINNRIIQIGTISIHYIQSYFKNYLNGKIDQIGSYQLRHLTTAKIFYKISIHHS